MSNPALSSHVGNPMASSKSHTPPRISPPPLKRQQTNGNVATSGSSLAREKEVSRTSTTGNNASMVTKVSRPPLGIRLRGDDEMSTTSSMSRSESEKSYRHTRTCRSCGKGIRKDFDSLVTCFVCLRPYHEACRKPALYDIGNWMCFQCRPRSSRSQATAGAIAAKASNPQVSSSKEKPASENIAGVSKSSTLRDSRSFSGENTPSKERLSRPTRRSPSREKCVSFPTETPEIVAAPSNGRKTRASRRAFLREAPQKYNSVQQSSFQTTVPQSIPIGQPELAIQGTRLILPPSTQEQQLPPGLVRAPAPHFSYLPQPPPPQPQQPAPSQLQHPEAPQPSCMQQSHSSEGRANLSSLNSVLPPTTLLKGAKSPECAASETKRQKPQEGQLTDDTSVASSKRDTRGCLSGNARGSDKSPAKNPPQAKLTRRTEIPDTPDQGSSLIPENTAPLASQSSVVQSSIGSQKDSMLTADPPESEKRLVIPETPESLTSQHNSTDVSRQVASLITRESPTADVVRSLNRTNQEDQPVDALIEPNSPPQSDNSTAAAASGTNCPANVSEPRQNMQVTVHNKAAPSKEIFGLFMPFEKPESPQTSEDVDLDPTMRRESSFLKAFPEYAKPAIEAMSKAAKEAKIAEIKRRPSRKEAFGRRLAFPRPYQTGFNNERDGKRLPRPPNNEDVDADETKKLSEIFGLPKNAIPMLHNGQLAFRDGILVDGKLPRSRVVYKVGRKHGNELRL